jgi:hypothetical protein
LAHTDDAGFRKASEAVNGTVWRFPNPDSSTPHSRLVQSTSPLLQVLLALSLVVIPTLTIGLSAQREIYRVRNHGSYCLHFLPEAILFATLEPTFSSDPQPDAVTGCAAFEYHRTSSSRYVIRTYFVREEARVAEAISAADPRA